MSKPALKLHPGLSADARLLAYYELKAREFDELVRQLENSLSAVMDAGKRNSAQRRIKRLASLAADLRAKAERLGASE